MTTLDLYTLGLCTRIYSSSKGLGGHLWPLRVPLTFIDLCHLQRLAASSALSALLPNLFGVAFFFTTDAENVSFFWL